MCPIFAMPLRLRANPTVLNQIWFVSNFVFHFNFFTHTYIHIIKKIYFQLQKCCLMLAIQTPYKFWLPATDLLAQESETIINRIGGVDMTIKWSLYSCMFEITLMETTNIFSLSNKTIKPTEPSGHINGTYTKIHLRDMVLALF